MNATVGRFAGNAGIEVTQESLTVPDGTTYKDGDECSGKPAEVRVLRDGEVVDGNPNQIRLCDGGEVAFVFAPVEAEIPPVPSAAQRPDLGL